MAKFEFDGEQYRKASTHQTEWGTDLINSMELAGDERVLDLGCGDGSLTARLAARVPSGQVLGIDASSGMIEAAIPLAADNLCFEQGEIEELDHDAEFDVIFSNAALHWIRDHRNLLERCHRALRPGGLLRLNFAAAGNCSHLNRVARHVMDFPGFRRHFSGFQWPWFMPALERYQQLLAETAFSRVQVSEQNRDRYFADTEAMTRWLDQPSLVPFLEHLPSGEQGAFRDNVVSEMIDLTMQPDGACFETFRRIDVQARR
jgi:trans-aconitate 2-methyltransferase